MVSTFNNCPGLFYAVPAQDGILSRLRIPGGIINLPQCRAIADIADNFGGGYVDITNRANLQIREIQTAISDQKLEWLQELGLASHQPAVDHIRNIMTSPTAGIDPQELIDTRSLVKDWDNYITQHPALGRLSAKFSVCLDGGGKISLGDRRNDITLTAELGKGNTYFRLYLRMGEKSEPAKDTGILSLPGECLGILAALSHVYLESTNFSSSHQPRLREVINSLGWENYLEQVSRFVERERGRGGESLICRLLINDSPVIRRGSHYNIGIHPQRQMGLFYIGVVVPLGRLKSSDIRILASLAEKYSDENSPTLRLTPWQNLLITHIPQSQLADVKGELRSAGFYFSTTIRSGLVACSGKQGCIASATETKDHALNLAEYLEAHITLDDPVNIHFTGCVKSCAQHYPSDITLLGVKMEKTEGYHVYLGGIETHNSNKFGRQVYEYVPFSQLPELIHQMLQVYQVNRLGSQESFREFTSRYFTNTNV